MAGSAEAVSDNGEEGAPLGILQSAGRRFHQAFSSSGVVLACLGLALFYGWTLTGVYGAPLFGAPEEGGAAFMAQTALSAACGVGACLAIGLGLWRARDYGAVALGCALASAAAALCCAALSPRFPSEVAAGYMLATRLAAPVVAVGWGAAYARMEPYPATVAVLLACLGGFALLAAGEALPGAARTALVAALLPASAALLRAAGRRLGPEGPAGALGRRPCAAGAGAGEGEAGGGARRAGGAAASGRGARRSGGRQPFRAFLALVWRVMLVFALFGVATWVTIVTVSAGRPAPVLARLVSAGGAAAVGGLLAFALLSGDSLARSGIYRLGLPLVMVGTLLFASQDAGQVFGATLMSVGYTCFDMLCFVLYAAACRRCGAEPLRAFALCMGVESGVPAVSVALVVAIGWAGGAGLAGGPLAGLSAGRMVSLVIAAACVVALLSASVFSEAGWQAGGRRPEAPEPSDASRAFAEASEFAAKCIQAVGRFSLSPREAEVLMLLARGRSVPFIAERLGISRTTVKTHIEHIYRKLGVSERQEMLDAIEALPGPGEEG